MVTLVEEKVEGALYARKAHGDLVLTRYIEQPLRSCQDFLCPGNALLHRCVGTHKRSGHFVHAKTAQDVQHERDLCFLGKPGMTAEEHHAKLAILDGMCAKELFHC